MCRVLLPLRVFAPVSSSRSSSSSRRNHSISCCATRVRAYVQERKPLDGCISLFLTGSTLGIIGVKSEPEPGELVEVAKSVIVVRGAGAGTYRQRDWHTRGTRFMADRGTPRRAGPAPPRARAQGDIQFRGAISDFKQYKARRFPVHAHATIPPTCV